MQSYGKAPIMAGPRFLANEERLESEYRSASKQASRKEKGTVVVSDQERQNLITLNRLNEFLIPKQTEQVVKVNAITRSTIRRRCQPEILQEAIVQQIRLRDQDEEK